MINSVGNNQGGYWDTALKGKDGGNSGSGDGFAAVFQAEQVKNMTGKEFLATLKTDELAVLQKVAHLADPIDIRKISEEGARNILAKGDKTKFVDLNNDGITEIGAGKSFIFPPPNAPRAVKDAWEKTTANMSFKEKMLAEAPFLVEQLVANIHQLPDGSYRVVEPGEPDYVNPFNGDSRDFCSLLDRMIANLTDQLRKETDPQFKKNREFQVRVLQEFLRDIQDSMSDKYAQYSPYELL